jgi:hypothetical protein
MICKAASTLGIIAFVCALAVADSAPVDPVRVSTTSELEQIGDRLLVIADPDSAMTMEEVLAGDYDDQARTFARTIPNLGYPRHPWWVELKVSNDTGQPAEHLLVLWRGRIHWLEAGIQSVSALPFPLRFLLATHPALIGRVLGIVYRVIAGHLIRQTGHTQQSARTGAVTLIQRRQWKAGGFPARERSALGMPSRVIRLGP